MWPQEPSRERDDSRARYQAVDSLMSLSELRNNDNQELATPSMPQTEGMNSNEKNPEPPLRVERAIPGGSDNILLRPRLHRGWWDGEEEEELASPPSIQEGDMRRERQKRKRCEDTHTAQRSRSGSYGSSSSSDMEEAWIRLLRQLVHVSEGRRSRRKLKNQDRA